MEYKKGAIQSVIQKEMLPIFHHIKELNSLKTSTILISPLLIFMKEKTVVQLRIIITTRLALIIS